MPETKTKTSTNKKKKVITREVANTMSIDELQRANYINAAAAQKMREAEKRKQENQRRMEDSFSMNGQFDKKLRNSMRIFGIPHQFTDITDPRLGSDTRLGRSFAERIIGEAPIVAFQPGVPEFLPGMTDEQRKGFFNAVIDSSSIDTALNKIFGNLDADKVGDDVLRYYQLKTIADNGRSIYSELMAKVNVLCKLMAVFIGIADKRVPWAPGYTFGNYDWRYYTANATYMNVDVNKEGENKSGSIGAFVENALANAAKAAMDDTEWIRFFVDSNVSFSESVSNSTTTSVLNQFTDSLEGMAKELEFVSGMAGVNINELTNSMSSSADEFIQKTVSDYAGPLGTVLSRISSGAKQIISGGNFMIPEIWSNSEYSKNYSFSITLSTPYGCPESWFLNVGVPMMHLLGLALPQQVSANTYRSPYLIRCHAPGWFNCEMGIIDSLSMDKGADSSWNVGGLPNEVKVNLSVKDLYSTLAIPAKPYEKPEVFLSSGMLEYLMVNCGVDLTNQELTQKIEIWATIIANNITDRFTSKPYEWQQWVKNKIQGLFDIF